MMTLMMIQEVMIRQTHLEDFPLLEVPSKRFCIIVSKDQCKWSLPEELACYCNEQFLLQRY